MLISVTLRYQPFVMLKRTEIMPINDEVYSGKFFFPNAWSHFRARLDAPKITSALMEQLLTAWGVTFLKA